MNYEIRYTGHTLNYIISQNDNVIQFDNEQSNTSASHRHFGVWCARIGRPLVEYCVIMEL